mgnify:CR=1 FL=1
MLTERLLEMSLIGAEWVLWLLVILSFFSLAVVVDRIILFVRTRERIRELEPKLIGSLGDCNLAAAQEEVRRDSLVRNVVRAGLDVMAKGHVDPSAVEQAMMGAMARERDRYEARLPFLGTIGNNAPFIGLFGTVLGIIQAFHQLGKLDASQASSNQIVMSAISEALIATAVGILVAIPAVAAYNWGKSSIASRVKNAESLMRAVLAGLDKFNCKEPKDG